MNHDIGPHDIPHLHDHVALDEIELYAEVLIAVADTDRPLSPSEIDRVLGVAGEETDRAHETPDPREPSDPSPAILLLRSISVSKMTVAARSRGKGATR